MPIYSLYIISKSGSLLYQRDFKAANSPITKQNSNDYLIIASNLHGIHTIAAKLTPAATKPSNLSHTGNFSLNNSNNNANLTSINPNTREAINAELDRENRSSFASMNDDDNRSDMIYDGRKNVGGGINIHSNKTGLRCVKTEKFNMFVHQTVTGVKIIILTSTDVNEYQIANFQITIHKLYSDYVMKNPFYSLDMPIRIKLFDDKISSAVINHNVK